MDAGVEWFWYDSIRRGSKAHAFLPGKPKSLCDHVKREDVKEDVTTDVVTGMVKVKCCTGCERMVQQRLVRRN